MARGTSAFTNSLIAAVAVRRLGSADYGRLALVFSILALMPFADLGIGSGLISRVAHLHSSGDAGSLQQLYKTSLVLLAGCGVFMLLFAGGFLLLAGSPVSRVIDPTGVAFLLAAVGLALPLTVAQRFLIGLQRSDLVNVASVAASIISVGLTWIAVTRHSSIGVIAFCWYTQFSVAAGLAVLLLRRLRPGLQRVHGVFPSRLIMRRLLRTGLGYVALAAIGSVAFESDGLLISWKLGSIQVAVYDLHSRIFLLLASGSILAVGPLWPAFTQALARGDISWVRRTLRRTMPLVFGGVAAIGSLALIFLSDILRILTGGDIRPNWGLAISFLCWALLMSASAVLAVLLNGFQRVRLQVNLGLAMLGSNIVLSLVLTRPLGPSGPVLATVVSQVVFVLVPGTIIALRLLRTSQAEFCLRESQGDTESIPTTLSPERNRDKVS